VAVVFPGYRLSPEARYPSAIEECYTVAKWVAASGHEHGLDGTHLAVAGDSVGGNIAAALTLLAKQRSGPNFAAQVLFYRSPTRPSTPLLRQFAEGYHLRRDAMMWSGPVQTKSQRVEITASPLRAHHEQLAGLPPALSSPPRPTSCATRARRTPTSCAPQACPSPPGATRPRSTTS